MASAKGIKMDTNLDNIFFNACKHGDVKGIQKLLESKRFKDNPLPRSDGHYGFGLACENGHLDAIRYLLGAREFKKLVIIHSAANYGFKVACEYGQLDVIKYLAGSGIMPLKDTQSYAAPHNYDYDYDYDYRCGLIWACHNGHSETVKYLVYSCGNYTLDYVKGMNFNKGSKILKEDVTEMIKARDLKKQLSEMVSFKNEPSIKNNKTL